MSSIDWAPKELSVFTIATTLLICLVALIGNLLIIILVVRDPLKKLRTPFNYFIANLAISDLFVG